MILCDTGPLVADANRSDGRFHVCTELFTGLHLAGRRILVPGTVAAEVGYLLSTRAGVRTEVLFLHSMAERLGVTEVATLDHRHFRAVRPRHVSTLQLLP